MDTLNFKHLFYFYIIAKEGSIKAAAEVLHVSQPTISDQLKLLENYLDSQLFYRRNRCLILTPDGELALDYAERIFSNSNELTQVLKNKVETPKNSIDVGITHYMNQYFLYDILTPLFKQVELRINIYQNDRRYLLADLEKNKLDIIFTNTKDSLSKSMSAYQIGVNKTYVVAHKKYKALKRNYPFSLNDIPFFNYTKDSFLRYEIELFFVKNQITPKCIGEGDDIDLFELVTTGGFAFTILPEPAKKRLCKNPDIITLGEIKDLQTHVWGVVQNTYKGPGRQLLPKT